MNIELDEVVVQDASDDALEKAAGVTQGGPSATAMMTCPHCSEPLDVLRIQLAPAAPVTYNLSRGY
jgi:hypothetical protein